MDGKGPRLDLWIGEEEDCRKWGWAAKYDQGEPGVE